MADTKIEWCDKSWNPIAGCTKCSPGCDNCYAERMSARLAHMGQRKYQNVVDGNHNNRFLPKWNNEIYCDDTALDKPLQWRNPCRIFVCSMSDLFHPKVSWEFIDKVFEIMFTAPQHIYQILTKRPKQMAEYFGAIQDRWIDFGENRDMPPPFIHLGVSISNPDEMWKITELSRIPAAVRFVSFEPLLVDVGKIPLQNINWIVVGGESGPGAREMHPDWARNIRDQCLAASVPFFFKQWGAWLPESQMTKEQNSINKLSWWPNRVRRIKDEGFYRFGKKKAGRLLDGREWNQLPERR